MLGKPSLRPEGHEFVYKKVKAVEDLTQSIDNLPTVDFALSSLLIQQISCNLF